MGTLKTDKCFITDLPAFNFDQGISVYEYTIDINGKKVALYFNQDAENWNKHDVFLSKKHIFAGALINGKLLDESKVFPVITADFLFNRIKEMVYPSSPKEKLDNLFKTLISFQNSEGDSIFLQRLVPDPIFYFGHYFRSREECMFYFKTLIEQKLINAKLNIDPQHGHNNILYANITFKGLNYYLDLIDNGKLSNKCFVAMSFTPENQLLVNIRNSIKEAIEITGFKPILIDEVHYDCEKTINDAIIANLKECKFCIADFTEQKDGVYFESGFALGQGKSVIYTCRQEDFEKSHFDTNHFPHIIYNNPDELKQKLIDKINAWIK
ncbi:MAG TPA: hypothetical protein PKW80_12170 [Bacteroidales bacterium]|nr:hypothetical protein [Bacteroidales bacterium]